MEKFSLLSYIEGLPSSHSFQVHHSSNQHISQVLYKENHTSIDFETNYGDSIQLEYNLACSQNTNFLDQNKTTDLPPQGCKYVIYKGTKISAKRFHIGNSQIAFKNPLENSSLQFGQVKAIFKTMNQSGHWLLIDIFSPLDITDQIYDPFVKFPDMGAELLYNCTNKNVVINLEDFYSHIATLSYPSVINIPHIKNLVAVVTLKHVVDIFDD